MPRKYVVAGCGGVGGWMIPPLAHFIQYRDPGSMLVLVDGDHFEEKNLERQDFHTFGNKANVRANEIAGRFDKVFPIPIPAWIVSEESARNPQDSEEDTGYISASELVEEDTIVFAVVDNFATRKLLFDAARQRSNAIVISAGNDDDLFCSSYIYQRKDGVDVTDHPLVVHEYYLSPPDRNPGEMSCTERAQLDGGHQLLVANMAAATLALTMAHRYVFEGEDPSEQSEMYLDLKVFQASAANRAADPESIAMVDKLLKEQGVLL